VTELKDTSTKHIGLMSQQNVILTENFQKQRDILQKHTEQLDALKELQKNVCMANQMGK
jgi:hypothetical protein